MKKELLDKYLNNQCSFDELSEVVNWLHDDSDSGARLKLVEDDWNGYAPKKDEVKTPRYDYAKLLDSIHHKINLDHVDNKKNSSYRIVPFWLMRAAAILLIPVLSILIYTVSENSGSLFTQADRVVDSLEVSAPAGSLTVVKLVDGSVVHLNYGSKIEYPKNFRGDTRTLKLTGEGYFEIAHDPDKPFIVETNGMNIRVLGTKFNVKAYSDNSIVSTTLVEGKVRLEEILKNGETQNVGTMVPGQHVEYNRETKKVNSSMVNVNRFIDWKDGLLIFENSKIGEVTEKLARKFNVEFLLGDGVQDLIYTVTFVDESLNQILDLMSQTTPIQYRFLPREKNNAATYAPQKIAITRK